MSWHFSRALEAEFLGESSLDGARFAPWKLTPTAPDDLCSDKMKGTCHRSPFGMMFVPSTDALGGELLGLCLADFRARTSAAQEPTTVLTESAAGCGENLPGSFAKYDRNSRSWRTRQFSLLGGLDEFSETWPNWGLMRNGECLALTTPDSITAVSESGLLPTPLATDCKGGGESSAAGQREAAKRSMARLRKDEIRADIPSPEAFGNPVGMAGRMERLRAIGNGQVPGVAALAWRILTHNVK